MSLRKFQNLIEISFRCPSETLCVIFDSTSTARRVTVTNADNPQATNSHDPCDGDDSEWTQRARFVS